MYILRGILIFWVRNLIDYFNGLGKLSESPKGELMKKTNSIKILTECSIMVALSTVLSVLKLFEMPYGGSITFASMLPIAVVSYRHGTKYGLGTALVASVVQMLLGLKNFSYFTSPTSFIALALFDYILAFTVFGLAGIFKGTVKRQSLSLISGTALASILRYVCHVISGATVWAGLSIPTEAALVYSLSYNATYMIPETIILVLTAGYLASALDFRFDVPRRIKGDTLDTVSSLSLIGAGLCVLCALIADTILVFSKLQNSDSGEFAIMGLANVNWLAVGIISVSAMAVAALLIVFAHFRTKRS